MSKSDLLSYIQQLYPKSIIKFTSTKNATTSSSTLFKAQPTKAFDNLYIHINTLIEIVKRIHNLKDDDPNLLVDLKFISYLNRIVNFLKPASNIILMGTGSTDNDRLLVRIKNFIENSLNFNEIWHKLNVIAINSTSDNQKLHNEMLNFIISDNSLLTHLIFSQEDELVLSLLGSQALRCFLLPGPDLEVLQQDCTFEQLFELGIINIDILHTELKETPSGRINLSNHSHQLKLTAFPYLLMLGKNNTMYSSLKPILKNEILKLNIKPSDKFNLPNGHIRLRSSDWLQVRAWSDEIDLGLFPVLRMDYFLNQESVASNVINKQLNSTLPVINSHQPSPDFNSNITSNRSYIQLQLYNSYINDDYTTWKLLYQTIADARDHRFIKVIRRYLRKDEDEELVDKLFRITYDLIPVYSNWRSVLPEVVNSNDHYMSLLVKREKESNLCFNDLDVKREKESTLCFIDSDVKREKENTLCFIDSDVKRESKDLIYNKININNKLNLSRSKPKVIKKQSIDNKKHQVVTIINKTAKRNKKVISKPVLPNPIPTAELTNDKIIDNNNKNLLDSIILKLQICNDLETKFCKTWKQKLLPKLEPKYKDFLFQIAEKFNKKKKRDYILAICDLCCDMIPLTTSWINHVPNLVKINTHYMELLAKKEAEINNNPLVQLNNKQPIKNNIPLAIQQNSKFHNLTQKQINTLKEQCSLDKEEETLRACLKKVKLLGHLVGHGETWRSTLLPQLDDSVEIALINKWSYKINESKDGLEKVLFDIFFKLIPYFKNWRNGLPIQLKNNTKLLDRLSKLDNDVRLYRSKYEHSIEYLVGKGVGDVDLSREAELINNVQGCSVFSMNLNEGSGSQNTNNTNSTNPKDINLTNINNLEKYIIPNLTHTNPDSTDQALVTNSHLQLHLLNLIHTKMITSIKGEFIKLTIQNRKLAMKLQFDIDNNEINDRLFNIWETLLTYQVLPNSEWINILPHVLSSSKTYMNKLQLIHTKYQKQLLTMCHRTIINFTTSSYNQHLLNSTNNDLIIPPIADPTEIKLETAKKLVFVDLLLENEAWRNFSSNNYNENDQFIINRLKLIISNNNGNYINAMVYVFLDFAYYNIDNWKNLLVLDLKDSEVGMLRLNMVGLINSKVGILKRKFSGNGGSKKKNKH